MCYCTLLRVSWMEKRNAWVVGKIGTAVTVRSSIAQQSYSHINLHTRREERVIQGKTRTTGKSKAIIKLDG